MLPSLRPIARAALWIAAAALAGCASMEFDPPPAYKTVPLGRATQAPLPMADFSPALRCMDDLLLDYGARDITVIAEDLADPAGTKVAATRDMLIAAASDMSRRSRAVRVVAQGNEAAGTSPAYQAVQPQYVLRGSIQRPDPGTVGVELTMVNTRDGTFVPGVASRRLANLPPDSPSVRQLVQWTAMETFGRLAKVPYWTCLGQSDADPVVASEIRDWYDAMVARPREIIEYFQAQLRLRGTYDGPIDGSVNPQFNDAVARYREALGLTREPRLTRDFLQAYLAARHYEVKAKVAPPAVLAAAPVAQAAPVVGPDGGTQAGSAQTVAPGAQGGIGAQPAVGVAASAATLPAGASQPAMSGAPYGAAGAVATPPAGAVPFALAVNAANGARQFARDEVIELSVRPSRDAHVYCFLQDENRQISRFFPNRFRRDSRVSAAAPLQLPGPMRFQIRMNAKGVEETVSCFATERDVLHELPGTLAATDFTPLPVASLDQLRDAFTRVAGGRVAHQTFDVRPR